MKLELTRQTVLALYDLNAPTKISADASAYELRAVLLHEVESAWRPVIYASRSLSETERQYTQIEKEVLAVTQACCKFANYILGRLRLIINLLSTKHLDDLPPCVLRFRLRLARFNYTIMPTPGKLLYTADTLSCTPQTTEDRDLLDVPPNLRICAILRLRRAFSESRNCALQSRDLEIAHL